MNILRWGLQYDSKITIKEKIVNCTVFEHFIFRFFAKRRASKLKLEKFRIFKYDKEFTDKSLILSEE